MNTKAAIIAERYTRTATVRLGADGIVRLNLFADIIQNVDDARENVQTASNIVHGRKAVVLIDARLAPALRREPRGYYMSGETKQATAAIAILLRAHAGVAILRFVTSILQSGTPSRVFTDEAAAVQWLSQFTNR